MIERAHPLSLPALVLGLTLLGLTGAFWHWLLAPQPPFSTDFAPVDGVQPPPAAPSALPPVAAVGATARLGFVGDVMQHHNQRDDDFRASYAPLRERLSGFDLLVANLEFPVDPLRPVGPERNSVRFNGSPAHLEALAGAGFDLLGIANNHAWDQGTEGLARTIAEIEARGMTALGRPVPLVREAAGIRVGLQAFTIAPNAYPEAGARGEIETAWPPRDLPLIELNFHDWRGAWRDEGVAAFREQAAAARAAGAEFLVAFVHWGKEWHRAPSDDQRLAARDMIAAGFDLVVGAHPHVLQGTELVDGRLVAYSLGNMISDFVPLEARTGALLSVTLARTADGAVRIADFEFAPLLVHRNGHRVFAIDEPRDAEERAAAALARRRLGPGVRTPSTAPAG